MVVSLDSCKDAAGKVFAFFGADTCPFQVDPYTGLVRLGKALDFEAAGGAFYTLAIGARDNGVPAKRSAPATIRVSVVDVN